MASRSGALSLLEKKLVMLANQSNELPADGRSAVRLCPHFTWHLGVSLPSIRYSYHQLVLLVCFAPSELLLLIRQVGSTQFSEPEAQILASRFSAGKPGVVDAASLLQSVRAVPV